MGSLTGMIFVWDSGLDSVPNREQIIAALVPTIGIREEPRDVLGLGNGWATSIDHWLPNAALAEFHNPMGFVGVRFQWSSNALAREHAVVESRMKRIEDVAKAVVDTLRPRFGYMTHYENQLETAWLEQQVFVPLLAEDWHCLVSPSYHLVMHAPRVPVLGLSKGAVLHQSDAGTIVRMGRHCGPFDEHKA